MKKLYLLFCLSVSCLLVKAQVGELDPTFGVNGVEMIKYVATGSLVSDKGETFAIEVVSNQFNPTVRVTKYLSNGTVDITYGNFGYTLPLTMKYYFSAIQDDGKIVVAGTVVSPYFSNIHDRTRVARFNVDGSLDFSNTGTDIGLFYLFPTKLIKQGTDLVLFQNSITLAGIAGQNVDLINTYGGAAELLLARISPTRNNSSYSNPFFSFQDLSRSKSVAIKENKIIVAGLEVTENPASPYFSTLNYYISRYKNGSLDPTFGNNGTLPATLPAGSYENMLIAPDGKLVIANSVLNTVTGDYDFRVVRLKEDGSPDETFNGTGSLTTDFGADDRAYAIAFYGDKLIIAGAKKNKLTGDNDFAIARYNNDGSLDNSFSQDGLQTLGLPANSFNLEKIKIEGDRLLVYGNRLSASNETFKVVAAYFLKQSIMPVCPPNKVVSNDKGLCSAVVGSLDLVVTPAGTNAPANYTFSGATTGSGAGTVSGKVFNSGTTTATYSLVNNPLKTCSFNITVEDKEAPVITNVSASPNIIWLPNHKMVDVRINYTMADNCGVTDSALIITSNEAERGTDKDDVPDDWRIIDPHHIQLRAERTNKGSGRIYTVTIKGTDAAGNKTEQPVTVSVPESPIGNGALVRFIIRLLLNPSRDYFTLSIESTMTEPVTLKVVDVFGRIIETRSGVVANGTLQIGHEYRPGLYFAEVKQGDKKQVVVMIKY